MKERKARTKRSEEWKKVHSIETDNSRHRNGPMHFVRSNILFCVRISKYRHCHRCHRFVDGARLHPAKSNLTEKCHAMTILCIYREAFNVCWRCLFLENFTFDRHNAMGLVCLSSSSSSPPPLRIPIYTYTSSAVLQYRCMLFRYKWIVFHWKLMVEREIDSI